MNLRMLIVANSLSEQLCGALEEVMCYSLKDKHNSTKSAQQTHCQTNSVEIDDMSKPWKHAPRAAYPHSDEGGGFMAHVFDMASPNIRREDNSADVWEILNDTHDAVSRIKRTFKIVDVFVHQYQSGHVFLKKISMREY